MKLNKPLLTESGYACLDKEGHYFAGMQVDPEGGGDATFAESPFLAHLFSDLNDIDAFMKLMDTTEEGNENLTMLKIKRTVWADGKPMKAVKQKLPDPEIPDSRYGPLP